jgi:hypothetical protein
MEGGGGHFSPIYISVVKRCTKCNLALLIIPMKKDYEYEIRARTQEEIREEEILAMRLTT